MATRVVEGKKPYTGGKAISIDENKVISLNLRDENNLIIYDSGDDEIYVDLQLPDGIEPTDAFPVGITTGRVLVADDWDVTGTLICAKTTSGDNIKLLYGDDGTLWIDNGTGIFKQIYFKADVDSLLLALRNYIDGELAKKQNGVTSETAPTNPSEGDLWYDTTNDVLKVYDGSQWNSTGGGGGSGDVQVSTDTGNLLSTGAKLWLGTESDFSSIVSPDSNTMYIQYVASGGGWQPGANTVAYYKFDGNLNDSSGNNRNLSMYTGSFSYSTLSSGQTYCQLNTNAEAIFSNIPFNRTAYTVSGWCYWDDNISANQQKIIFDLIAGSNYFPRFYAGGESHYDKISSVISFDNYDNTGESNKWYHLIAIYDNDVVSSYINGQFVHSETYSSSESSGNLFISGTSNYSSNYRTNGRISELILEDKVRTAQEISDYYNQTKGNYGIS